MPITRPSAWTLIGVLVASTAFVAAAPPPVAAAPDPSVCDVGPTISTDDLHPPSHIYVLRSQGVNKGHVERVPLWDYVGVVLATEYSGPGSQMPVFQRMGAVAVKQYAWYYALKWRGSKVSFTVDNGDGTTSTRVECYNVKDTTADQLYKPEKWDPTLEAWIKNPDRHPKAHHLAAMRQTWHISVRKWLTAKSRSGQFLTGYRSGSKVPCGSDSIGSRIYQASMRDCAQKGLTYEETSRRYYEPFYLVDSRSDDILADALMYRGDLAVLVPGSTGGTEARIYAGTANGGFKQSPVRKAFTIPFSGVVGHGIGNVHSPRTEATGGPADPALLADLLMVSGDKLWLARANGRSSGFANPVATNIGGGATGLLVDDFNGDLLADAAIVRNGGIQVLRSQGNGSFGAETAWLGADLAAMTYVAAGDVNGDGKADIITRDASGNYWTAKSRQSCSNFSSWSLCPAGAVGEPGLQPLSMALAAAGQLSGDVKHTVGDYDRDGRADLLAVVKAGGDINVFGLRGKADGTFADPVNLQGPFNYEFGQVRPVAMNINPDSMADIALVSGTSLSWLRTVERLGTAPTHMTAMPVQGISSIGTTFLAY